MSIFSIGAMFLGGGGLIGLALGAVPIIGFIESSLGSFGAKAAKPIFFIVAAALLALFAWGAWSTWLHKHDRGVIGQYEADTNNMTANEVAAGTNTANAKDAAQQAADAERSNATNVAINSAVAAHPVETHHATGPASQAALDALRKKRRTVQ